MAKLVLKTVLITLAAMIITLAVVYFCLALAFPKALAKGWEAVGSYDLSIKYYEKQYEATEKIADLSAVCVKVDAEKDAARAVKYLKILTESAEFSDLCTKETDTAVDYGFTAYEIYFGKYAIAAYYKDGIAAAVNVATIATQNEYTKYNAFYVMLINIKTFSEEDGQAIITAVSEIREGLNQEHKVFADRDISMANAIN